MAPLYLKHIAARSEPDSEQISQSLLISFLPATTVTTTNATRSMNYADHI